MVKEIQIWTDVDGVLSADPRKIKDAELISEMSYEEAMELSYFGGKVIYTPTMVPALEKGIPLRIKNTFNPSAIGTLICEKPKYTDAIKVTSIEKITMFNMKGSGMVIIHFPPYFDLIEFLKKKGWGTRNCTEIVWGISKVWD